MPAKVRQYWYQIQQNLLFRFLFSIVLGYSFIKCVVILASHNPFTPTISFKESLEPNSAETYEPKDIVDELPSPTHTNENGHRFLIDHIRNHHLLPYNPDLPTNYTASRDSWAKYEKKTWLQLLPKYIISAFNFKKNGFFIECGALDGHFLSNTLLLEKTYDWTGLLVEADPAPLQHLRKRNRHAWVVDACLSPKPYPTKVQMTGHKDVIGHGFIENDVIKSEKRKAWLYNRSYEVECFPLESLLEAINTTEVDYLSLDVEGVELDILKTIPFGKVSIQMISVEVRAGNRKPIEDYLTNVGYEKVQSFVSSLDFVHDDIYKLSSPNR